MTYLGQSYLPNLQYLRPDIVMLCANDGWDIRALKEARSLAAGGYSISIVGSRHYHTELARFTDEYGLVITNVPKVINPLTMRLHMESGVWTRMNLYEKCLATILYWIFENTGLRILPKAVPPPVTKKVLDKINRRKTLLQRRAKLRGKPKRILPKGGSLWWQTLREANIASVVPVALRVRGNKFLFLFLRLMTFGLKVVGGIVLLPFIILGTFFYLPYKAYKWLYRRVKPRIPEPPHILGRLHAAIISRWSRFGRNVYRYSRFFLYTIEYGETVVRLNPRVIHAHDLYTLQAATRIARWTGVKVVYDAHELESDRRAGTGKFMRKWIINQEKKYAPRADEIVTISYAVGDEIVKNCNLQLFPTIVFNAPVIRKMPVEMGNRTVRTELNLSSETPLFVFVGKIYEIHNSNQKIDYLIDAIGQNPDFHLAMVGPMSDKAQDQINALTKKLNIADRIHHIPPIPPEAIVHYIKDADVGIYFMWPDTRNIDLTIPNKLFEFSLAGLPLVLSSLHSTRWFCDMFGNAIYVEENSPEAISKACTQAFERRDAMTPKPHMLVYMKENYSWQQQAEKLWDLYKNLLLPANRNAQSENTA